MAPHEDPSTSPENQHPGVLGPKPRARRPRRRRCLLKGCRRKFRPQQPLARYCNEACRERARQWRAWKARRRYRQSANGKQRRQAQSRRYRDGQAAPERKNCPRGGPARVIPTKFFLCSCDRPGCYAEFHRTRRSPLQRFCSPTCRHALERVLQRERRWHQRTPGPEDRGSREKASVRASLKPCRYRPDILQSPRPCR
jgi:hypothetical protein